MKSVVHSSNIIVFTLMNSIFFCQIINLFGR